MLAALAIVALLSGAVEDEEFVVEDVAVDADGGVTGAGGGGGVYTSGKSGAREARRMAGENRRRAADVDEDDAFMRNISHFTELEAAESFMMGAAGVGAGARALAFFARVHSAEHDVFLTVARQLMGSGEVAPALGRATVKRHTSGATVNLIPALRVATADGGSLAPLLTRQYRVPDVDDADGVTRRWTELHADATERPARREMWEQILEAEALALHAWVQAGALPAVASLDRHTIEPLLRHNALAIVLLPPGANPALRSYYLRRVHAAAARFPSVTCEKGALPDGAHAQLWLPELPRCNATAPAETIRFAHVDGASGGQTERGSALASLAVRVRAKGLLSPVGSAARFVVLRRERSSRTEWRVTPMEGGQLTTDAMVEFCREQLPWARGTRASR